MVTHSDRPSVESTIGNICENCRYCRYVVMQHFSQAVWTWGLSLNSPENKRTICTLTMLYLRGLLPSDKFIHYVESCKEYIEDAYICKLIFTGLVMESVTHTPRQRFVIEIWPLASRHALNLPCGRGEEAASTAHNFVPMDTGE